MKKFLHVTKVIYLRDFILELTFNDGVTGELDFRGELNGEIFLPLNDKIFFLKFT